ncbi:uncharacterized protein LOC110712100 [Chenopodium quinoa]|uniref:uncharacterized protein LOC110712100 n=1 Tax=Chenopodium quinoa TaxID=63459 RepID=UPI000B784D8B|nr:uncharacterized protein LOC110712100 [Chenopodium quinoa]
METPNMGESGRIGLSSPDVQAGDVNVSIFIAPSHALLTRTVYNTKGGKEFKPGWSMENKPIFRMKFNCLQDGIDFYYKYASECGFKIRSSTSKVEKKLTGPDALLSKEDVESFVWLFQNILKCMGNEPSCLIIDQDPAMELCAVVWDREIEPNEFVDGWNTVMEKYDLVAHECCNSTYGDGVEFSIVVDNERQRNFDVTFDLSTLECTYTCKMFESQGVLCRHILFIMKGKSISEIPEHYVLTHWRKDVKKKSTSVDEAINFDKKKRLIFDVCSKMFSCVSLAEGCEDDMSDFVKYLSSFEEELMKKKNGVSFKEGKEADIQLFVGSNDVDVDILPLSQCLNKGSARSSKFLKSAKEVVVEEKSKKGRTCRACGQSGVSHDSRNCPKTCLSVFVLGIWYDVRMSDAVVLRFQYKGVEVDV